MIIESKSINEKELNEILKSALVSNEGKPEFYDCEFESIEISGNSLSEIMFEECIFKNCDFSNSNMVESSFIDCHFFKCKLMGIHFNSCNKLNFSLTFDKCLIDYSIFDNMSLDIKISNSRLHQASFVGADLRNTYFDENDFKDSDFESANLEGLDLSTCYNLLINPENTNILKCKFSIQSLPGLLDKYKLQIIK